MVEALLEDEVSEPELTSHDVTPLKDTNVGQ